MILPTVITLGLVFFAPTVHAHISNSYSEPNVAHQSSSCECAPMSNRDLSLIMDNEPLHVHNEGVTSCDELGRKSCQQKCLAWAMVSKSDPETPGKICEALHTTSHGIKPALFSRRCGDKWIYAGLTSSVDICCKDGKRVPCPV